MSQRPQQTYDHRLRNLVRETGDLSIATELGVPRSTAAGWLRGEPQEVISLDLLDMRELQLQAELAKQRGVVARCSSWDGRSRRRRGRSRSP